VTGPAHHGWHAEATFQRRPLASCERGLSAVRPREVFRAIIGIRNQGLFGLIPQKRGPRRAHKLTPQVLEYVRQIRSEQPALGIAQVGAAILDRFGITVHPRSIERALARQEKKRR